MTIDPKDYHVYKILNSGDKEWLDPVFIEIFDSPLCIKLICIEEGTLVSHLWDAKELRFIGK